MIRRLFCLLILIFTAFEFSFAQSVNLIEVKGHVADPSGEELVGVTVISKISGRATITDAEGNYAIKIPDGDVLSYSYIGYKSQYLPVKSTVINVTLREDATHINEVVVTGYAVKDVRKSTGSVAIISGEELMDAPLMSVDKLMQGKLVGVSVQSTSGRPGEVAEIRIRGVSSITGNNEPLWVVDGVPLQKDIPNNGSSRLRSGDFSDLFATGIGSINANDIESINVLKDAAAAAIYGSQASSGVIVVTTKRGKAGKTNVNYSGNLSVQFSPNRSANLMNSKQKLAWEQELWDEFSQSGYEATQAGNITHYPVVGIVGMIRSGYKEFNGWSTAQQDAYIDELGQNTTDWNDVLLRNSISMSHYVSISGGDEKLTYYTSGGYNNNEGILINNSYDSYNFNAKINATPNDKVAFGLSTNYSYQKSVAPSSNVDVFNYAYFANPYESLYNEDGSYRADYTYFTMCSANGELDVSTPKNGFNLMRELNETSTQASSSSMTLTGDMSWKILENLRFTGLASFTYTSDNSDNINGKESYAAFIDRPFEGPSFSSDRTYGSITQSSNYNSNYMLRGQLNYSKTFGSRHYLSVLGGSEIRSSFAKSIFEKRYGYDTVSGNSSIPVYPNTSDGTLDYEDLQSYAAIVDGLSGQSIVEDAFASFYAAADYILDNKYVFNATVRTDGSNNFGSKEQFNATWSTGFSWNIDQEEFFDSLSQSISSLTFRTATGYTGGVNKSVYPQFVMSYDSSFRKTEDDYYRMGYINNAPNPNLRWERTWDVKAALDMGLFEERLRFLVEFYHRKGFDLVTRVKVPYTTGFSTQSYNTSEQYNQGVELSISATPIRTNDFSWNVSVNGSYNNNKLTAYNSPTGSIYGDLYVGYPLGKLFTGIPTGINPKTGIYNYKLRDDAEIITDADLRDSDNYLFYVGTSNAPINGGLSTSLSYKNFIFSVSGSFSVGGLVQNDINSPASYSSLQTSGGESVPTQRNDLYVNHLNVVGAVTNRWTVDNPITDGYPRLIDAAGDLLYLDRDIPTTSTITKSVYYEKVSYLKVGSITLGYNVPQTSLRGIGISSLGFSVNMNNLLTITNYSGIDPESPGAIYPQSRSVSVGVNVGF